MLNQSQTVEQLLFELKETQRQLYEAQETIDAIRTGQVDALVLQNGAEPQLYTLQTADQAYRAFIERMTEGAVTLSRDGVIMYANSQFAAMVKLPLSQILGTPFSQYVLKDSQESFSNNLQAAWAMDVRCEIELRQNNESIPVQLSLTLLDLEEGQSISTIVTDLTLQKQTQQQLELQNRQLMQVNESLANSNHDLQQFASVASHDLQEPLRKIQMFATFLKENAREEISKDNLQYLNKVLRSADRMKTLIVDVLTYSRLSSDHDVFLPVDLNIVLADVLEDFELLVEEKNATIICSEMMTLEANQGQIRQMFQNLISNALKFSKPGHPPVISISCKRIVEKKL